MPLSVFSASTFLRHRDAPKGCAIIHHHYKPSPDQLPFTTLAAIYHPRSPPTAEMRFCPRSICLWVITLACGITAQPDPRLTGTWCSKSKRVVTGPVCYDSRKHSRSNNELYHVIRQKRRLVVDCLGFFRNSMIRSMRSFSSLRSRAYPIPLPMMASTRKHTFALLRIVSLPRTTPSNRR